MLGFLAARATAAAPSPTVDLYFLNAFSAAVAPSGPVSRLAPTVFATKEAILVLRHDAGAPVPPAGRRRLIYLIDDAIFAGIHDPSLPLSYRLKLAAVDCRAARRLLPRAEVVVVSGPEVAEALPKRLLRPGVEIVEIGPYWSESPPDLSHFTADGPLDIAFTGARTHAADLAFAAPALAGVLSAMPAARVFVAANHRLPPTLRREARCCPVSAIRWPDYRRALVSMRRRIAVYPLSDSPFARARSTNKLIEHALMGAAGLYAEGWTHGREAAAAGAGLALPRTVTAWREALDMLAADPEGARAMAKAGAALARACNRPEPQRALWARLLSAGGAAERAA